MRIRRGIAGYGPLIRESIHFLHTKLQLHRYHPEFNGPFEYEDYNSVKSTKNPNEGYATSPIGAVGLRVEDEFLDKRRYRIL